MSHAVRYITYAIGLLILLTFVYVAVEQTVREHRQARRERAHPGYLPPTAYQRVREPLADEENSAWLETLRDIDRLPEARQSRTGQREETT